MSRNIAIDIGNTRIKLGIFENDRLVGQKYIDDADSLIDEIKQEKFDHFILSSVKETATNIIFLLNQKASGIILGHQTRLPFTNQYKSPDTLGRDRIAVVAAAAHLFPHDHKLVIDAGTCITYDLVDSSNNYFGGAISPGLAMRFQALHTFTAALPLIKENEAFEMIGDTTEKSILAGVIGGIIGEMNEFIANYEKKLPDLKVLITGGNGKFFETKIKGHIFAIPELVLKGLNTILEHNVSK